jgi:hypothetical protein
MPEYRVFMTRTRTIKEHAVVVLNATSPAYAGRDAKRQADNTSAWNVSAENKSEIDCVNIQEL